MDEQNPVRLTANGITIEVDLRQILTAIDPQGKWIGYDPDEDEERFVATSLEEELVGATALLLVKSLRKDVVTLIKASVTDQVNSQVAEIIRETLTNPIQRTNEFGGAIGEAKPLTEMISETATAALTKPAGDSYGRGRSTVIQKIIDDQIGAGFKKELQDVVAQARRQALATIQTQASEVIAEAVRRATPGL